MEATQTLRQRLAEDALQSADQIIHANISDVSESLAPAAAAEEDRLHH